MRVYVASNIPTAYPWKLQKPATIDRTVRETATESFIFDSGIGDDTTNEGVLDYAHEHDADYVVAKDYLHDQARTTESVREFLELYPEHPCEATPLIPLQPPFDQHYAQLDEFDHYVLGGMAKENCGTKQQLKWIRDFRRVAPDVYAHGLGVGGGWSFVRKVAPERLLDSIDCATPEMAAIKGKVLNGRLQQQGINTYNGDGSAKRTHPLAEVNSWQLHDVWKRELDRDGGLQNYGVVSG